MTAVIVVSTVVIYSVVTKYVLSHVTKPHPVQK